LIEASGITTGSGGIELVSINPQASDGLLSQNSSSPLQRGKKKGILLIQETLLEILSTFQQEL
jgi:hypothetical protein